jgi:hypothetical protein
MMPVPLEVFCCYAREDQEMLAHLKKHLMPLQRQGQITVWSDTNLNAGVEWEKELHQHLESADIILLLISPDFMASDYCYSTEMGRAIERHDQGNARVIPILLRPTFWSNAPFATLQMLPEDARPVKDRSWFDSDEAFNTITERIHQLVSELQSRCVLTQQLGEPFIVPSSRPKPKRPKRRKAFLITSCIFAILVGSFPFFAHPLISFLGETSISSPTAMHLSVTHSPSPNATATFVAENPDPYLPNDGSLAFFDPLRGPDQWYPLSFFNEPDEDCTFTNQALLAQSNNINQFVYCPNKTSFKDFVFEVQMTILQGDCGGMVIRAAGITGDNYLFGVCQDGTFFLFLLKNNGVAQQLLPSTPFSAIQEGRGKTNVLAVIAKGAELTLYANYEKLATVTDNTYSQGQVGVVAYPLKMSTEVSYSNAKVWVL